MPAVEWPTLALLIACYGAWIIGTTWAAALWLPLGVAVTGVAIALHSSLCHEALHGHPFRQRLWNEAVVFPCLCLVIPYGRFRDTHLAHHREEHLTDPYDDPESNYLDPKVWAGLSRPLRTVLSWNNTLAGRILLGPAISQVAFMRADWRAVRRGDRQVLQGWLLHLPGVALVLGVVWSSPVPLAWYLLACYGALSILKIRTFLEHQAHVMTRGRTVIVEDRGLLAFLFLNNNLHVVHHMHPRVPWYRLPRLYRANAARYLACNEGYRYGSYREVFARHFRTAKDPVPHPLWSRDP